ncbi:TonB-dependent receptor plug domain-containing protein [Catenovulum adriaticum]|uniref:TonB-dependent receptor n=1 Tax=Catenovulum adriaticum TaxID=2984846 RepID=A0ABY7AQF4_9ALTE|nr:TonB-dependent receptor [Catenovulum sp. TS8]WAJ71507.1 TonB-dependent receptor [Catenovulum sp. TS8]
MNLTVKSTLPALLCSLSSYSLAADNNINTDDIERISIEASPTANKEPVGTFDSPVSNLDYDPRVDLQSRNMAEAQADISIRGGIFENTGFRVGSATLLDPQTGHYVAELPIAPQMLRGPYIMTGADNALFGLNSSVGTVAFDWKPISSGGQISIGAGSNDFNLQSIYAAKRTPLKDSLQDWHLGVEGEFSRSASDGSIDNGDHHFKRASGRIQLTDANSQTDLFFGLQEKFFGWPNLYTPFNVNETEDLKTRLLMLNHKQNYANQSSFEVSAYYRRHNDHYIYSRENPEAFQTFHETEVKSIAFSGRHVQTEAFAWNYSTQLLSDSIESTALENNFTTRNYIKASILPEYKIALTPNELVTMRLGASFDDSNRDDSKTSLLGDLVWHKTNTDGRSKSVYFSYAQASQVAGYTAIGGSDSGGLFRSNYELERETTTNLELGLVLEQYDWRLSSAIFYRKDDNLTDWTYNFDSTSARYANPVDIDTTGLELLTTRYFDNAEIVLGYTFLRKSEDYGDANIDASFYALNYPNHRVTLGTIWQLTDIIDLRLDNEWRKQEDNLLRNSDDDALFTHLTLTIKPEQLSGLMITLAADNLWNESFEEVPGTPGRGEQYTVSATYNW